MIRTPSAATPWFGFMAFAAGSLLFGEAYPFSRVPMYAPIAANSSVAVPRFMANGREASPHQFERFSGIEPQKLAPEHAPITRSYLLDEARAWIAGHPLPNGAAPGPVHVEMALDVVERQPDGAYRRREIITEQGRAWPRP
jgi:hypothetical protein